MEDFEEVITEIAAAASAEALEAVRIRVLGRRGTTTMEPGDAKLVLTYMPYLRS